MTVHGMCLRLEPLRFRILGTVGDNGSGMVCIGLLMYSIAPITWLSVLSFIVFVLLPYAGLPVGPSREAMNEHTSVIIKPPT